MHALQQREHDLAAQVDRITEGNPSRLNRFPLVHDVFAELIHVLTGQKLHENGGESIALVVSHVHGDRAGGSRATQKIERRGFGLEDARLLKASQFHLGRDH